jgi:signal transduction histidine kinase
MTFKSKLLAGVGTALAILISIGVLSYRSMTRSRDAVQWVTHTHVVLEQLEGIQSATVSAESAQRGFLLSGDETYRKSCDEMLAQTQAGLRRIRVLTADNPVQQRALDRIEPLINARIAILEQVSEIRESHGLNAAVKAVQGGAGNHAMEAVRDSIQSMEQEENDLLVGRMREENATATLVGRAIVFGNALSFLFLFVAGVLIYQEMDRRKHAEESVQQLNADLEHRVTERTAELRLRTEDLARSNSELQQFAYVASHDLQEPLRMVASFTQLLAKRYNDKLGDDAREFIHFAVDGATRLQTLITDLLSYSRVGTHAKPLTCMDADRVLDRVLASLKLTIQETSAQITREKLPAVMADEIQLGQLLQNLLTNALKFRGADVPRIHISSIEEGGFWRISVRDNGIGIAPEHTDRIWVIFQRLHTKAEYPGTGIGLAICKKIAERHGGSIRVEPTPGGGSTFSFTIPILKQQFLTKENTEDESRTTVAAH